jgi:hypothetical protein
MRHREIDRSLTWKTKPRPARRLAAAACTFTKLKIRGDNVVVELEAPLYVGI